MELRPQRPKRKKRKPSNHLPLPLRDNDEQSSGYFNGLSVIVPIDKDTKGLIANGAFGKARFSWTTVNDPPEGTVEILRKRQHEKRSKYPLKKDRKRPTKVIVVPDSDSEDNEGYFSDLKPTYAFDRSVYENSLVLSLVEAYFLSAEVGCVKISNVEDAWKEFNDTDRNFTVNYTVYLHFRAKNWVVKSGIKFGGDYMLYKDGPVFYHASYVVIIDVIDENLKRIDDMQRRSMEYTSLIGLNRLCESTGKELLICQVMWPENCKIASSKDINKLSINEVLLRRFTSSQY